ncbi:MAG: vitamin K epoxide reductase family protein, partial [Fimbriimonadaceae bacterium]
AVSPTFLSRLSGLLAFFGVFVAGYLTVAHFAGFEAACGEGGNCAAVQSSEAAFLFGVPVALLGLVAYLVLGGLNFARTNGNPKTWIDASRIAFILAAVGAVFSIYLQYQSLVVIGERCDWCIASAVIMTLVFLTEAFLLQAKPPAEAPKNNAFYGATLAVALLAAALVSFMDYSEATAATEVEAFDYSLVSEFLPREAKVKGPADSPITVLEFADYNCPACRRAHFALNGLLEQYNNQIRIGFRHRPIPSGPTSTYAAVVSEYAAEQGVFWEYQDAIMDPSLDQSVREDREVVLAVAREVGLDAGMLREELSNDNSDLRQQLFAFVIEDTEVAATFDIRQTPSFVVFAEGMSPQKVSYPGLERLLARPEYRDLLK